MKSGIWVRHGNREGETFTENLHGFIWVQFDDGKELVPISELEQLEDASQTKLTQLSDKLGSDFKDKEGQLNRTSEQLEKLSKQGDGKDG